MKNLRTLSLAATALVISLAMTSCSNDDEPETPPTPVTTGLFVVCNGNFGYGNGSLSLYDPATATVSNDLFARANGMKLGDVAQSMSISGKKGWICVNNSNVVFAIDTDTYKELGRVEGVVSPRNTLQVSDSKLYVSQMYSTGITVVNPTTYKVTTTIEVPGMDAATGSTEQLVKVGDYVYCNCWSYQKQVVKIDTKTDRVVASLEVGLQPQSMALTDDGKTLWVLTDGGGWPENPIGYEAPALHAIDLATFKVTRTVTLPMDYTVQSLCYHDGYLYWLGGGVQRMSVTAIAAPDKPYISSSSWGLYAMTVNPNNGDIYVADAIDYMQPGVVTRYSNSGTEIGTFTTGVIPASFCWKY